MLAPASCFKAPVIGSSVRPSLPKRAPAAVRQAGAAAQRRRLATRAAAEKEGDGQGSTQQQQAGVPVVPDTPPTPAGGAAQQRATQAEPSMSVEEIQRRAGLLRQQRAAEAAAGKDDFIEGVKEEVRLIKWPAPLAAGFNTLLVIGIVAGTAAVLLGINGLLTEVSNVVY